MTVNTSKLIIGTAVIAVVLMLFASVPAVAETNRLEVKIEVTQGINDTTHDEWKWVDNELTISGDYQVGQVLMTLHSGVTAKIHIDGTLTVYDEDDDSVFDIETHGSDCLIDGGGKLVSKGGLLFRNDNESNSNPVLTIDGLSVDIDGNQDSGIAGTNADVIIRNCPEVILLGSCGLHAADIGNGKIVFEKSNVHLDTDYLDQSPLIMASNGIYMDGNPTGPKVFFKIGDEETDKFVSGETTSIWHREAESEEEVFYLEMNSYSASDEPSAENNLLMKVVVVGCSLIAIVCFVYALFARK